MQQYTLLGPSRFEGDSLALHSTSYYLSAEKRARCCGLAKVGGRTEPDKLGILGTSIGLT